jgi:hypothetical protein
VNWAYRYGCYRHSFRRKIKIEIGESIPNISNDYNNTSLYSYGLDGRALIPGRGKRFLLLHGFQTGAHPASYPMGKGALSPEGKTAGA